MNHGSARFIDQYFHLSVEALSECGPHQVSTIHNTFRMFP